MLVRAVVNDSSHSDAEESVAESPDDPAIAQLMARGRPDADLAELRALAGVKRGLFDQTPRPILLSRYVLLERIGAGGLGVVFAAYDPSLDRRVAIKLLQARTIAADDADGARERLVREAQAIARLAHPNVVAVHDVGTYELERSLEGVLPRGVFVVMEYIDGEDLDVWVRARPRHWSDVLAVYLAAGRGLAAAHRAGLVHRDCKPGNVLIARDAHGSDALGRARVLDFGLVRAHGSVETPQRPDRSAPSRLDGTLTRVGGVLGTPAYMAPEQHVGMAADARSDQYAFCVALWEALFGVRPFSGNDANTLATAKRTFDIVPPPSSSRVPQAIVRTLRRGLSPQPEQRFADMASLLDALAAVPRRRRRVLGLAIAIPLGGALVAAFALRPTPEPPCRDFARLREAVWNDDARAQIDERFAASRRPHARRSARAVLDALDAYATEWDNARRGACESALVYGRTTVDTMNRVSLCLDRDLAQAGELVALLRDADDGAIDSAVDAVDALPPLSACTDAPPTSAPDEGLGEIERTLARADAMFEASHYDQASALAEAARRSAEREGRVGLRARAELVLGRVQVRRGDLAPGVELLHASLASAERVGDEQTAVEALLALTRHALDAARIVDATRLLELADAKLAHHRLGEGLAFEAAYNQAILARLRGDYADAVASARDALARAEAHYPAEHTAIARAHGLLGIVLSERGELDPAAEQFRIARDLYERRLGPDHPHVADMIEDEAQLDEHAGRHQEALAQHLRALEIRERVYGSEHPLVAVSFANLAAIYLELGERDESRLYSQRARAILVATHGELHPDSGAILTNLANLAMDEGDHEEALVLARDSTRILAESVGEDNPRTAYAIATEGIALTGLGRYDEALARLARARTIFVERAGTRHTALPIVDKALAEAELGAGRIAPARAHAERALAGLVDGPDRGELGGVQAILAAIRERDDPGAAAPLWAEAEREWLAGGRAADRFAALRSMLVERVAAAKGA